MSEAAKLEAAMEQDGEGGEFEFTFKIATSWAPCELCAPVVALLADERTTTTLGGETWHEFTMAGCVNLDNLAESREAVAPAPPSAAPPGAPAAASGAALAPQLSFADWVASHETDATGSVKPVAAPPATDR